MVFNIFHIGICLKQKNNQTYFLINLAELCNDNEVKKNDFPERRREISLISDQV